MKLFLVFGLLTVISGVFALFQNNKNAADVPQIEQSEVNRKFSSRR
jgi:hypothetical protein